MNSNVEPLISSSLKTKTRIIIAPYCRPAIPLDSPLFQPGLFKACFSDLWRCSDLEPELDDGCRAGHCSRSLRGLCALPPQRSALPAPGCGPTDRAGLTWTTTKPGDTATQPCPAGQDGAAEWRCNRAGAWDQDGPDLSGCVTLQRALTGSSSPDQVLDQVRSSVRSMGAGDIPILIDYVINNNNQGPQDKSR